jgi:glycosyltransferase involved in cell wall biosynthesis
MPNFNSHPTPIVSVVLPTFKRPDKLDRSLASVLENRKEIIEVLVVDDDPNMSGAEVVRRYSNVRYICKSDIDRGLSYSRNIGITIARGSHLIFLDDDDYLLPGAIDAFIQAISPDKTFYFADFSFLRPEGRFEVCLKDLQYSRLLVKNIIPVGAYMIQATAIRSNFCNTMKSHEDWDFLLSNVNWNQAKYVNKTVAVIDKTEEGNSSMQIRRRSFFWMEYIGIYSKFPAPELANERKQALSKFDINIPVGLLENKDSY